MSQIYEFERIGRIRSWQSSPFPPYLNNVRDTPICKYSRLAHSSGSDNVGQDKHYTSIDPAKHDSFFTSGRVSCPFTYVMMNIAQEHADV